MADEDLQLNWSGSRPESLRPLVSLSARHQGATDSDTRIWTSPIWALPHH